MCVIAGEHTQKDKMLLTIHFKRGQVMDEKMKRRLGITLFMLGVVILIVNGIFVIGHYMVGWPIFSFPTAIGVAFLVIGLGTVHKKQQK